MNIISKVHNGGPGVNRIPSNPAPLQTLRRANHEYTFGISDRVFADICEIAIRYGVKQVILFGSRARGDAWERSDIDLASSGGDFVRFALDLPEEAWTLLGFDIVSLDESTSKPLLQNIADQGIVLFEAE